VNPFGHSPYVTFSLTRGWVCLLWIYLAFVKSTYRTYSMLLKIRSFALYTSPLSVQALQSRSCVSLLSLRRFHGNHVQKYQLPRTTITMAVRSKAWTVFARSNTGVVDSNHTRGMNVCLHLFCVFVVQFVGSGLAAGWSPTQGILPPVYD
jgi:hypothetical protein